MRQDRLQNMIGTIRDKRKRIDSCGGIHPYGLGHSAFLVLAKCSFPT